MATRPDQFPRIAARTTKSEDVRQLFEELHQRAEMFAQMMDEFTKSIIRNRERREGKPVKLNSRARRTIANFEKDAEQAVSDLEKDSAQMEDASLLGVALAGTRHSIRCDEQMLTAWHADDQPMAIHLINYQGETLKLIENFIETSRFKNQVPSLLYDNTVSKPVQRHR